MILQLLRIFVRKFSLNIKSIMIRPLVTNSFSANFYQYVSTVFPVINPFPCGIGPFGPGSLWFNTTQKGLILKILKNYVIHGNCLSFIFIFKCFIKKCYFIPVIHGFLGPTQKSWAIRPNAALWTIFNKCRNNLLNKIRPRPFVSLY